MPGVGQRLREMRTQRGFSQAELGRRVGVSGRVVWTWEAGRNQIGADDLPNLARALGVSYAELLGEPDPAPAPAELQTRDTTIADRVRDRLLAEWEALPEDEQAVIDAIAEDLMRWRATLLREEHTRSTRTRRKEHREDVHA